MAEYPAAQPVYRVPRSDIDDFFERGTPLPGTSSSTGVVLSVDGETVTVQIGDDIIGGVVILGDDPVEGDAVELESRGDLLVVVPNTYAVGAEDDAIHIVSADDPGLPAPEVINIGGSMKDLRAWNFLGGDAARWARDIFTTGGIRCWQQRPAVLVARNIVVNPSFEFSADLWTIDPYTPNALSDATVLAVSAEQSVSGNASLKATWAADTAVGGVGTHVLGVVAGTAHTASLSVLVPAGSPDVRFEVLGAAAPSWVTTAVKDTFTRLVVPFTPTAGDVTLVVYNDVLAEAGDSLAGSVYIDAVQVTAGATVLDYFDGSTVDQPQDHYTWDGQVGLSTSAHWKGPVDPEGMRPLTWDDAWTTPSLSWDNINPAIIWDEDGTATGPQGTLWNSTQFDVAPRVLVEMAATLTSIMPSATAQFVVLYGPVEGELPIPGDPDSVLVRYGTALTVDAEDEALAASFAVEDTLAFPLTGDAPPLSARLGIEFIGDGDADLVVEVVSLSVQLTTWPLGSLWLDPDAESGGLLTVGSAMTITSATQPVGTVNAWQRSEAVRKAIVKAPPYDGGIVQVHAMGSITQRTAAVGFELRLVSESGQLISGQVRSYAAGIPATVPFYLTGMMRIGPGEEDEVFLEHRYTQSSATEVELWNPTISAIYMPDGVVDGDPPQDPLIRWWDGDSWRPEKLVPAEMNLSQPGTDGTTTKIVTTTALALSGTSLASGSKLTMTATVSPAATGSVTFQYGKTTSGPWTSYGAVALSGSKAVKTVTPGAGSWYFRAAYGGSATHAPSSKVSALVKVSAVTKKTVTIGCSWGQAYEQDNSQMVSSHDHEIDQGYYSASTGGNRKSLARFVRPAFPAGTKITSVVLQCSNWYHFYYNAGGGTLVLGWFHDHSSIPASWPPAGDVVADRSRHKAHEGAWSLNITSWAAAALLRTDFSGITFGAGSTPTSFEYYGKSHQPVESTLKLVVTYEYPA